MTEKRGTTSAETPIRFVLRTLVTSEWPFGLTAPVVSSVPKVAEARGTLVAPPKDADEETGDLRSRVARFLVAAIQQGLVDDEPGRLFIVTIDVGLGERVWSVAARGSIGEKMWAMGRVGSNPRATVQVLHIAGKLENPMFVARGAYFPLANDPINLAMAERWHIAMAHMGLVEEPIVRPS